MMKAARAAMPQIAVSIILYHLSWSLELQSISIIAMVWLSWCPPLANPSLSTSLDMLPTTFAVCPLAAKNFSSFLCGMLPHTPSVQRMNRSPLRYPISSMSGLWSVLLPRLLDITLDWGETRASSSVITFFLTSSPTSEWSCVRKSISLPCIL